MNDQVYERFFLSPDDTWHRRYEVLRAVFVERLALKDVAKRFEIGYGTVRNWASEFRTQCNAGQLPPFLFSHPADVPHSISRRKSRKLKSQMPGRCPSIRAAV